MNRSKTWRIDVPFPTISPAVEHEHECDEFRKSVDGSVWYRLPLAAIDDECE